MKSMNLFFTIKIFFIILLLIGFYGCAASIQDLSKVQYIKEGFNSNLLTKYGFSLLPIVAGQGQEGYRRPFGDAINETMGKSFPNVKFIQWQETMNILNDNSLTKEYEDLILTYRSTAIIDKKLMQDIGQALNTRFLLFVSLEDFTKSQTTSYNFLLGWNTSKTATVNGFAQVWDCVEGDVVWEGYGTAYSKGGELTYEKDYEEYSNVAAKGLIYKLFNLENKENKSSNEDSFDTWNR